MSAVLQSSVAAARRAFYDKIDKANVTPLWEVLHSIITATPSTPCKPYLWKWDQMWPWIQEAGRLISAKEAERRVLVLENPGLRGRSSITHSLYAGLQLILPGEVAPLHRHSQSALRFILLGTGAYTAVDGEKVTMSVGDFVITPSWTFHDHGNPSEEPMVWMDGLDVPLVELLDAQFMEKGSQELQHTHQTEGDNLAQFGNTMKPVEYRAKSRTSPLFWYPYQRTREALETLRQAHDAHPCWGHKLQYTN
ncbi:MAG: cupin domain-containing protein, partial [Betaproteobacteria bacterium]